MVVLLPCLNQDFSIRKNNLQHALHDKIHALNHTKYVMPIDTADKLQLSFSVLLFFIFLKCTTTFEI